MPATPKSAMRTRRQDKARQAYQDAKARKACVEAVWARAGGCCEQCGRWVYPVVDAPSIRLVGHVHEILSRALGGSPYAPSNCQLLCPNCHMPNGAHRRSVRATV